VAFVPRRLAPSEIGRRLAERGFMAGYGNFYAVRLLEALGVDPEQGAVRVSFVHYTTPGEISGLIAALDAALAP
jgi:selenocysteine lyase/cysteine desulfurase